MTRQITFPIVDGFEEEGRCRSCGAPIKWTVTVGGKRMPVDRGSRESHFATCPDAKRWRR
jgi:hypothetical protein